jgi:hypothetical protein
MLIYENHLEISFDPPHFRPLSLVCFWVFSNTEEKKKINCPSSLIPLKSHENAGVWERRDTRVHVSYVSICGVDHILTVFSSRADSAWLHFLSDSCPRW